MVSFSLDELVISKLNWSLDLLSKQGNVGFGSPLNVVAGICLNRLSVRHAALTDEPNVFQDRTIGYMVVVSAAVALVFFAVVHSLAL